MAHCREQKPTALARSFIDEAYFLKKFTHSTPIHDHVTRYRQMHAFWQKIYPRVPLLLIILIVTYNSRCFIKIDVIKYY